MTKIIDLGRYALSLFNKYTGEGVRIFVDPAKLGLCPECGGAYPLKQGEACRGCRGQNPYV